MWKYVIPFKILLDIYLNLNTNLKYEKKHKMLRTFWTFTKLCKWDLHFSSFCFDFSIKHWPLLYHTLFKEIFLHHIIWWDCIEPIELLQNVMFASSILHIHRDLILYWIAKLHCGRMKCWVWKGQKFNKDRILQLLLILLR